MKGIYFRLIVLACFLCCTISPSVAQKETGCLKNIREIYNELSNSNQDKGVYLRYRVTTSFLNPYTGEVDTTQEVAKLYLYKDKSMVEGSFASIYKDSLSQVVVFKDKKTVLLTDTNMGAGKQQGSFLLQAQDSLFNNLVEKECEPLKGYGEGWVKAVLEPQPKFRKGSGIEKVVFIVNIKEMTIRNFAIHYSEESTQKEVSMEILEADYQFSKIPFQGTALAKVMQKEKQLLSRYASYQLVDARKRK